MRRALLFAASSTAMVGCLLTTSLDGLSGGAADDAAPSGEAGADAPTGGDAALDVSVPDGAADQDSAPPFCTGATFCDQFDDPGRTSVQGSWTDFTAGLAAASLVGDAFSPPKALLFSLAPTNGGAGSELGLHAPLDGNHAFHFEFRMKATVDANGFGGGGYASVFSWLVNNTYGGALSFTAAGYDLGFVRFDDPSDAGSGVQEVTSRTMAFTGQWVKVSIDVTFSTDPSVGHVRAQVGDTVAVDKSMRTAAGVWTNAAFSFGLSPSGQVPAIAVVYDDVLVR